MNPTISSPTSSFSRISSGVSIDETPACPTNQLFHSEMRPLVFAPPRFVNFEKILGAEQVIGVGGKASGFILTQSLSSLGVAAEYLFPQEKTRDFDRIMEGLAGRGCYSAKQVEGILVRFQEGANPLCIPVTTQLPALFIVKNGNAIAPLLVYQEMNGRLRPDLQSFQDSSPHKKGVAVFFLES